MGIYRAAVIGLGRIGFEFDNDPKRKYIATHTGAYRFVKEAKLVAVCDKNRKKLKECMDKLVVPKGYTDFKEMLKKEEIDILSICTPPDSHYQVLKKIANYPVKAVFCEKPLAGNVKDAERMVKLCKEKKIILQVDHQRRFDPLHINLRRVIKNKKLGNIQQVNFYYTAGIRNTGSHMFDLLKFFFGDIEWIEAFYSKNEPYQKDDPNLDGIIRFQNGVFATFQACDVKKYLVFELNCFLEKGRFVLKNSGFSLDCYKVGTSKYFLGYKELFKTNTPFKVDYKRNFMINGVKHLIKCLKTGHESISSGEDGLMSLKCITAAIFSVKNGGRRIYIK